MKISLVTAVYNRRATLGTALASAAAQSHRDIEHLIQDGGSTDGSLEVIGYHHHSRMLVVSQPDSGIYDALNRAIARATGEAVGVLHSDDVMAHDGVLAQVAEALRDPAIDGVYGDLDYVAAEDTNRVIRRWRAGAFRPGRLKWGWMPPHPALFLRRRVYEQRGGYDTSFRIAADYEALLRYLTQAPLRLLYIPQVMVKMRVGGESNRSLGQILTKSAEDLRAMRLHGVGGIGTLAAKNLRKIPQFMPRVR
jgi:glycosyltransferase involved in cell wall biosynthesis